VGYADYKTIRTIFIVLIILLALVGLIVIAFLNYKHKKQIEQQHKEYQERLPEIRRLQAEQQAKEQAKKQAERERWQPIRESAIEAINEIPFNTHKGSYVTVNTQMIATAILNVMTTEPMSAKEINIALGEDESQDISAAISYIEQAMPIKKSKKIEETVIMKGGWPMKDQHPVTAYALHEDIKAAIFTYISTKPNESFTIDDIDLMDGKEFEEYIAKLFTKMGYEAEVTKASNDQGIDVIAKKDGTSIGIQAKRYSGTVGNSAVQEAVGGKAMYKVDKVMVITNNEFTSGAKKLAQANDVVLWDRNILKDKVSQYRA